MISPSHSSSSNPISLASFFLSTHSNTPPPPSTHIYRGGIHVYEENAVKVFFFVTAPVWLSSILLIQLFGFIAGFFRPRATKAIPPASNPTHHTPVQSTESAQGGPGSGAVLSAPATTAFANTESAAASEADDVEQLSATQVHPTNKPSLLSAHPINMSVIASAN